MGKLILVPLLVCLFLTQCKNNKDNSTTYDFTSNINTKCDDIDVRLKKIIISENQIKAFLTIKNSTNNPSKFSYYRTAVNIDYSHYLGSDSEISQIVSSNSEQELFINYTSKNETIGTQIRTMISFDFFDRKSDGFRKCWIQIINRDDVLQQKQ